MNQNEVHLQFKAINGRNYKKESIPASNPEDQFKDAATFGRG